MRAVSGRFIRSFLLLNYIFLRLSPAGIIILKTYLHKLLFVYSYKYTPDLVAGRRFLRQIKSNLCNKLHWSLFSSWIHIDHCTYFTLHHFTTFYYKSLNQHTHLMPEESFFLLFYIFRYKILKSDNTMKFKHSYSLSTTFI